MNSYRKALYGISLLLMLAIPTTLFGQKDTIILKNGDRVIGEIKIMRKGVLTIETAYSDKDFAIDWIDIKQVKSRRNYLITLSNGMRLNTEMYSQPTDSARVRVNFNKDTPINIKDIVFVQPVDNKFISRVESSFAFGYNYTKSSNLSQLTSDISLSYKANYWNFSGACNMVNSIQDDAEDVRRIDGNAGFNYYLKKNWFAILFSDFLSNDEQKLILRTTVKAGGGKYFTKTNRRHFAGGLGLAFNNEKFSDSLQTSRNSLEGFASLELNFFGYEDIDLLSKVVVYPSLTISNRVRMDFTTNLKYDLLLNFFVKLGFTYNFDSKPVEGASKNDYIIQTTLGWEFD